MEDIEPKKISVVVQGPIIGVAESDPEKQFTRRSLESVRKALPGAEVILSTWRGSNITGLDYDMLVLSDEPERLELMQPDRRLQLVTVNLQITSSWNGLQKASRQYTIKMRSDMVLEGVGFIRQFLKFNKRESSGILRKRVVVLPTYNPRKKTRLLFDTSDWFFFGLTEDVKNIFNIPLMDKNKLSGPVVDGYHFITDNYCPEQYIWTTFLRKHTEIYFPYYAYFTAEALASSERLYAEHTIMVPANIAQICSLKMPGAGYGARPILSQGLYTFNEYKQLNNKYTQNKVFYFPNPIEDILYFLLFNARLAVKVASPQLYKNIVNFIRKLHGSSNLLK